MFLNQSIWIIGILKRVTQVAFLQNDLKISWILSEKKIFHYSNIRQTIANGKQILMLQQCIKICLHCGKGLNNRCPFMIFLNWQNMGSLKYNMHYKLDSCLEAGWVAVWPVLNCVWNKRKFYHVTMSMKFQDSKCQNSLHIRRFIQSHMRTHFDASAAENLWRHWDNRLN